MLIIAEPLSLTSYTIAVVPAGRRTARFVLAALFAASATLLAQAPPPPPAQAPPPPRPTQTPVAKPTPAVAPAPQSAGAVDPRLTGVPIYTGASFLYSLDMKNGQWLFVFGTNDAYAGVVAFYKDLLRKSGVEVTRTPRIQQFDFDRASFDSNTQQRPSILVKDFAWPQPTDAYLHVSGTTETRYKTVIQIIPATK